LDNCSGEGVTRKSHLAAMYIDVRRCDKREKTWEGRGMDIGGSSVLMRHLRKKLLFRMINNVFFNEI
jgi:hypothetical protein